MGMTPRCKTCRNIFNPIYDDDFNLYIGSLVYGINCSSHVDFSKNQIFCGYGSDFDMNLYEFINGEVPDFVESGLICDECINQLIDTKKIKLIQKNIL